MDQLKPSASEGLISKDTIMDAESCDILPLASAKPKESVPELSEAAEDAEAADEEAAAAVEKELEAAEMVEVNIDGGDSDKEAADEEQEAGGGGGGGGSNKPQKQRRPKKGFVQSLLGVLRRSSPKASPPESPQQSVSSKSFLRGLRPLISRIRKNETVAVVPAPATAATAAPAAPAAASGSSSNLSFSDKDVQTAIQEARANLQNAHEVAEKIFSENMGD